MTTFIWGFCCGAVCMGLIQFFLCCATSIEIDRFSREILDEHEDWWKKLDADKDFQRKYED